MATRSGTGNGDVCPVTPDHGHMLVMSDHTRQYCPHHDHEGRADKPDKPGLMRTRAFWPTGMDSFPKAVAEYMKEFPNG